MSFKDMLRRLGAALVAAICMVVWSGPAAAGGLQSILQDIAGEGSGAYTAGPSRYQAAGRHVFSSGGFSVRVSTSGRAPTLISVTPPNLASAGCGGVSAHFGGFSFISGAQIEQWVRTISQGAVGFVVNLAIKSLCPICEAVLSLMQRLAQAASALAIDGCRAGEALAQMATDFMGIKGGSAGTSKCGTSTASLGAATDFLSAVDGLCGSVNQAMGEVEKYKKQFLGNNPTADELAQANAELGIGNQTWNALKIMGVDSGAPETAEGNFHRLVLMSLTGAEVVAERGGAGPACTANGTTSSTGTTSGSNTTTTTTDANGNTTTSTTTAKSTATDSKDENPACYYPPIANSRTLWAVFLCGWDKGAETMMGDKMANASSSVKTYCSKLLMQVTSSLAEENNGNGTIPVPRVWNCADDYKECKQLKSVPISDLGVEIKGYYPEVMKILHSAVADVAGGKKPSNDFLKLVESTDLPIYQALNVAAVYPQSATTMLEGMGLLIAQSLASGELQAVASRLGYAGAYRGVSGKTLNINGVMKALEDMSSFAPVVLRETGETVDLHMKLYAQIADINKRIQQNVISKELLTSEKYASRLRSGPKAHVSTSAQSGEAAK